MLVLTTTFVVALLIAWVSIPSIIRVAQEKHLYDEPSERKAHALRVPTLGGVAIFAGLIIASTFFLESDNNLHFGAIFSATIILFFTGIKDDIIPLSPIKKMIAQLLACTIVVIQGEVQLTSLYGLFNVYQIPDWLGVGISIFTILVIINAFNLIDGINGLAGGIAFIVAGTFGIWFFINGYQSLSIIAVALCGALAGFLRYNLIKAKVFMGDTGSLVIGLISAILAIQFIELSQALTVFRGGKAPIFAVAVLIVPLFDTLRVFIIRVLQKRSPFSGDRNHIHHLLLGIGFSHLKASLTLYTANLLFIVLAFSLIQLPPLVYLGLITTTALSLSLLPFYIKQSQAKEPSTKKVVNPVLQTKNRVA
ncbi:MAG: MraY family glycosyltransferase, partial [Bacteroidota bacterium]